MAINRSTDTFSHKVRAQYNQNTMEKGLKIPAGVYRGIVVDTIDPNREGRVKVHIAKFYGTIPMEHDLSTNIDPELYLGAMWCIQLLPFGGTTPPAAGPNGIVSQNSYGITGVPPSLHNEVLVAFSGDTHSGIVLGIILDSNRRAGINGAGVTRQTASGKTTIGSETSNTANSTNELPDEHPQAARLEKQGLDRDRIRGCNFSSPTRDPSPRTMGLTSLTGHSMTLDDGDLEDGDNLGIRIRTAAGAQILMDDTNGLTYIINREGNVWIELNRAGDIDIYSSNSMNFHTEGDMNIHCGGNFNVQTGRNINMRALGIEGIKLEATSGSFNMKCEANMNLEAGANGNLRVVGNYRETAGRIDMNGPPAAAASTPTVTQLVGNINVTESVATRVPEAEPWAGHLDVSVLDTSSASGAAAQNESKSYYDGTPTGPFDINNFPKVQISSGDIIQYTSSVDRRIDQTLIDLVTKMARIKGIPLTIISGYRSPSYNTAVSGAKRSQHMLGHAVDISGSGLTNQDRIDLIGIASSLGIKGIGVYNSGSMHFDNRDSARAGWGPDFTQASVPSYAVATMNQHRSGGFA